MIGRKLCSPATLSPGGLAKSNNFHLLRLDPSERERIIEALGSLGDDRATVEGLAALLDREDISSRVYEALFHVGQRAGMRVLARKGGGYEIRPFD